MRSIEMLSYRYEGDAELVERLHHAGEVEKRAAESIDLVDDHAINLAGLDGSVANSTAARICYSTPTKGRQF